MEIPAFSLATFACFDADILHHEAAAAVEALLRTRFADRGVFLTRIGLPPKRAFLFRVTGAI